jgi:hypothetical protein
VLILVVTGVALIVSPPESRRDSRAIITAASIRDLAAAAGTYERDMGRYPRVATISALRVILVPTYIKSFNTHDAWGDLLTYHCVTDGLDYVIVSPGGDARLDETTAALVAATQDVDTFKRLSVALASEQSAIELAVSRGEVVRSGRDIVHIASGPLQYYPRHAATVDPIRWKPSPGTWVAVVAGVLLSIFEVMGYVQRTRAYRAALRHTRDLHHP